MSSPSVAGLGGNALMEGLCKLTENLPEVCWRAVDLVTLAQKIQPGITSGVLVPLVQSSPMYFGYLNGRFYSMKRIKQEADQLGISVDTAMTDPAWDALSVVLGVPVSLKWKAFILGDKTVLAPKRTLPVTKQASASSHTCCEDVVIARVAREVDRVHFSTWKAKELFNFAKAHFPTVTIEQLILGLESDKTYFLHAMGQYVLRERVFSALQRYGESVGEAATSLGLTSIPNAWRELFRNEYPHSRQESSQVWQRSVKPYEVYVRKPSESYGPPARFQSEMSACSETSTLVDEEISLPERETHLPPSLLRSSGKLTLHSYFSSQERESHPADLSALSLFAALEDAKCVIPFFSLLGHRESDSERETESETRRAVSVNTTRPFSLVATAVSRPARQHMLQMMLEAAVLRVPQENVVCPPRSTGGAAAAVLVLHRAAGAAAAANNNSTSGAVALLRHDPRVAPLLARDALTGEAKLSLSSAKGELVVLVSPHALLESERAYAACGAAVAVKALQFGWQSLSVSQVSALLSLSLSSHAESGDVAALAKLRVYQRDGLPARYDEFRCAMLECNMSDGLTARLSLLDAVVASDASPCGVDLLSESASGRVVVCDLTDALLPTRFANAVFRVVSEQFRERQGEKLLVVEDAHGFLSTSSSPGDEDEDPLQSALIQAVCVCRDDLRVVLTTQDVRVLSPRLLDSLSGVVLGATPSVESVAYLHAHSWMTRYEASDVCALPQGKVIIAQRSGPEEYLQFPLHLRRLITHFDMN